MIQRKRRITAGRYQLLWGIVVAVSILSALWHQSFVSLADSTATVTVDSAKIRASADVNSEVIGSAARGKAFPIRDEVQDDSGMIWYQVAVDENRTGYIRSDLVSKQDGDDGQSSSQDSGQPSGATVQPDTDMDAQYASVSAEAIKVRSEPSTNASVVDRLERNAQVIVSGKSAGSDGRDWYFVTFTGTSGAERTGFIRSDLLTLGDMVPVSEEETPEPQETVPEPTDPAQNEYELTREKEEDGSYTWYLYDYTEGQNGYKQKLQQLLDASQTKSEESSTDTKTFIKQRIAIVVLIFLVVALIVAVVIMALKLRDVYYEDYEDEDETEQAEETQTKRRSRTEEPGDTTAQRRRRSDESEEPPVQRRRRTEESEEVRRRRRTEDTEDESEQVRSASTAAKRKSKNFLLDDDEFEFEFLNMEDKS